MTPVYALDAARWVVASLDRAEADGEIFNAVGGESVTQRDYYALSGIFNSCIEPDEKPVITRPASENPASAAKAAAQP